MWFRIVIASLSGIDLFSLLTINMSIFLPLTCLPTSSTQKSSEEDMCQISSQTEKKRTLLQLIQAYTKLYVVWGSTESYSEIMKCEQSHHENENFIIIMTWASLKYQESKLYDHFLWYQHINFLFSVLMFYPIWFSACNFYILLLRKCLNSFLWVLFYLGKTISRNQSIICKRSYNEISLL